MNIPEDTLSKLASLQTRRTRAYSDENDLSPDEIRDEIRSIADSNGYRRVGSGDYRVVYASKNYVVKVAWNRLGRKENRSEFENWRDIKDIQVDNIDGDGKLKARRYLAVIYENHYDVSNFGWIVMEKVKTGMNNVTHDEAKRLRESFSDAGISIAEIKPYNIGTKTHDDLDKETVAIFDYGGT